MTHRLFRLIANDLDRTVMSVRFPLHHNHGLNTWRPFHQMNVFENPVYEVNRHFARTTRADGKWNYDLALDAVTKPDDIKINVENNQLKISGKSKLEQKLINGDKMSTNWEWSETIKVPEDVNAETLNASFENNKISLSAAIIEPVSNAVEIPISKK